MSLQFKIFQIFSEQISDPIDQIEECKHDWKEDPRDDVYSFRASWELRKPSFKPVPGRQLVVKIGDFKPIRMLMYSVDVAHRGSLKIWKKMSVKRGPFHGMKNLVF